MHGISASPRRLPSTPVGRYEKAPTPTSARRYARNCDASWTPPNGTPVANNRHRFQHAVSTDETVLSMALNDCSITPLESAYRSQSVYLTVTPDPKNFAPQSAAAKRKSFQRCSQVCVLNGVRDR
ncbi:hypothetical protein AAVH_18513 [Aphelenchoides avenae]|nr:hypothetical protein AAVH_18513 [Aphelenchus avenae]